MNLGGLVSGTAGELYRRLVTDGPLPLSDAHAGCVAELDAVGLTTRSPCYPDMVVPVLPELAFGALLANFAKSFTARHEALLGAVAEVACWDADGVDVEMLTDPHVIKRTAGEVLAHAREVACEFAVATHDPSLTSVELPVARETGPGVRYRVVYAVSCLRSPLGRQIIEACRAVGEEQRFFSGWMASLRIGDDDVALMRLTDGALHVRSRALVGLLRAWFDLVWERSAPPEEDVVRLSPGELAVLEMQAAGHKDAAIARALGCNVRTVRRHVAGILAVLGVDSRFAAGVEAARRGWLT